MGRRNLFNYIRFDNWNPEQVASWLRGLDDVVLPYVQYFLNSGIDGKKLFMMSSFDLEKLNVKKIGHQELILESVGLLLTLRYGFESENLQSLALQLSVKARSLVAVLNKQIAEEAASKANGISTNNNNSSNSSSSNRRDSSKHSISVTILSAICDIISSLKPIVTWLDRSPFEGMYELQIFRKSIIKLGLQLLDISLPCKSKAHDYDNCILKSCTTLASLCDDIVTKSKDPLAFQPASLELATITKKLGETLGLHILSYHGIHVISDIKDMSPAKLSGKILKGDEVIQVNNQTVVGWQLRKLVSNVTEKPKEVVLLLKKRPHHTNQFGHIPNRRKICKQQQQQQTSTLPKSLKKRRCRDEEKPSRASFQDYLSSPTVTPDFDTTKDGNETDNDVFRSGSESPQYKVEVVESKQRRATVSGGSPTHTRPPLVIEDLDQKEPGSSGFHVGSPDEELSEDLKDSDHAKERRQGGGGGGVGGPFVVKSVKSDKISYRHSTSDLPPTRLLYSSLKPTRFQADIPTEDFTPSSTDTTPTNATTADNNNNSSSSKQQQQQQVTVTVNSEKISSSSSSSNNNSSSSSSSSNNNNNCSSSSSCSSLTTPESPRRVVDVNSCSPPPHHHHHHQLSVGRVSCSDITTTTTTTTAAVTSSPPTLTPVPTPQPQPPPPAPPPPAPPSSPLPSPSSLSSVLGPPSVGACGHSPLRQTQSYHNPAERADPYNTHQHQTQHHPILQRKYSCPPVVDIVAQPDTTTTTTASNSSSNTTTTANPALHHSGTGAGGAPNIQLDSVSHQLILRSADHTRHKRISSLPSASICRPDSTAAASHHSFFYQPVGPTNTTNTNTTTTTIPASTDTGGGGGGGGVGGLYRRNLPPTTTTTTITTAAATRQQAAGTASGHNPYDRATIAGNSSSSGSSGSSTTVVGIDPTTNPRYNSAAEQLHHHHYYHHHYHHHQQQHHHHHQQQQQQQQQQQRSLSTSEIPSQSSLLSLSSTSPLSRDFAVRTKSRTNSEVACDGKNTPTLTKITRLNSVGAKIDSTSSSSSSSSSSPSPATGPATGTDTKQECEERGVRPAVKKVDFDAATKDRLEEPTSYTCTVVGGVAQMIPMGKNTSDTQVVRRRAKTSKRVAADRRISCKDLGRGDCEGWLYKKKQSVGPLGKNWKKRWCVLKESNMFHYKRNDDLKAEGVIHLPAFKVSPAAEMKSKKFAFKVHNAGTTFYFASERQDDMSKWMNKMGLAAINYDMSNVSMTGGFIKPDKPVNTNTTNTTNTTTTTTTTTTGHTTNVYYSESEDENDDCGSHQELSEHSEGKDYDSSNDDLKELYRQLEKRNLTIVGTDRNRRRRSHIQSADLKMTVSDEQIDRMKRICILKRLLKDKEIELETLENILDCGSPHQLQEYKELYGSTQSLGRL